MLPSCFAVEHVSTWLSDNTWIFLLDSLWLAKVVTGFDFFMHPNRWEEEVILEQAVGGLEESEHKCDFHSELVYYLSVFVERRTL